MSDDSRVVEEACRECGMPCTPTEYHPYAACLMFRGCHNSKVVRENLRPLSLLAEAESQRDEYLREAQKQFTIAYGTQISLRGAIAQRDALQSRLELAQAKLDAVVGLLGAAVCPMAAQGCDGTQYPAGDTHGDFWGECCQWCHERKELRAALRGELGNEGVR